VKEIPKSNVNLLKRREFLNINRFGGGSVESKDESIRTKCKEINPEEKEAILYSINTFIYLGKIQNYSILNLKEKKIMVNNEKRNISYLDYKKL
jgi:hypothetical protein